MYALGELTARPLKHRRGARGCPTGTQARKGNSKRAPGDQTRLQEGALRRLLGILDISFSLSCRRPNKSALGLPKDAHGSPKGTHGGFIVGPRSPNVVRKEFQDCTFH